MKTKLLATVGLLLTLTLVACTGFEVRERHYASTVEALSKQGVYNWIPEWVPDSARNLRSIHDEDTLQQRLSFEAPPRSVLELTSQLEIFNNVHVGSLFTCYGWSLRPGVNVDAFLVPSPDNGILFIDRSKVRAFFRRSFAERKVLIDLRECDNAIAERTRSTL